ncbi:MAG TPA: hypothetical protein DD706_07040 [Nitrospiraceae bacterium]|nr:hypothetical protein [Nitrospiraceae bacterium]
MEYQWIGDSWHSPWIRWAIEWLWSHLARASMNTLHKALIDHMEPLSDCDKRNLNQQRGMMKEISEILQKGE